MKQTNPTLPASKAPVSFHCSENLIPSFPRRACPVPDTGRESRWAVGYVLFVVSQFGKGPVPDSTKHIHLPYWAILLALPVIIIAIVVCGSDTDPQTPTPTATAAASTEVPEPEPTPTPETEAAANFDLVLFGNEEHTAGDTISLSQFEGQPVVLNFWFPSCPPCVAEMPDFEEAYQKFKPDGVQFIGIQLLGFDTVEDGQKFVEKLGVNYLLGPDSQGESTGDIVRNYRIAGFPTTVFIDRDHNVVRRWTGALNLEKLEDLIQEIM